MMKKKIVIPALLAMGTIATGAATDAQARVTNFEVTSKTTAFLSA